MALGIVGSLAHLGTGSAGEVGSAVSLLLPLWKSLLAGSSGSRQMGSWTRFQTDPSGAKFFILNSFFLKKKHKEQTALYSVTCPFKIIKNSLMGLLFFCFNKLNAFL